MTTSRVLSVSVLGAHVVAAIGALVLLPRGFAIDDLQLWSNTVIPVAASLAVISSLVAWRRVPWTVGVVVAACAGGWIAAVALGAVLFPSSIPPTRWAVPAIVALALGGLAWRVRTHLRGSLVACAVGAGLGGVVILAQRAPLPSTRPAGGTQPQVTGEPTADAVGPSGVDRIAVCGLRISPLLTFVSRSPDRTWTILSPEPHGARRTLRRYEPLAAGYAAAFDDDGHSTLVVREHAGGLEVDAMTTLDAPVYSHLNSFTTIEIPFDATITFGPIAQRFPIEPADYPSGRPIKFAYLDDELHVVRAADAEKGPFEELAHGPLRRGESLVIEIRSADRGCRLTFEDWSAQVSTAPSPTAGWGVPQNSIQFFSRFVVIALAETGPGRGFDAVGHAAGTYRNRLRIEPL